MNAAVFSSTAARAVSVAKLCPPPAMVSTSGCGVPLGIAAAGALVHQTVIVGAQQQHRAVVALGLGKGIGVLCHLIVKGHLVAQTLHVGVVLAGLHNTVGTLCAAEPHPGARAQQDQAWGWMTGAQEAAM